MIPKQHFEKLHECPAELLGQVFTRIGKIAGAVVTAMNSDGYNLLCNNGRAAGQLIDHLHFHIVPRFKDDKVEFNWPHETYEDGEMQAFAEKIAKTFK